ncbi:MAG: site-2 protease family protein [Clostridia bacterium]|nr:site-2 protease family protein [Clostridia bacterium]
MEVLYFLIALLVLAIMIFVHELGHYTAGRLLGFRILDFSLGFGPALFQFKKKGINYALRAIPLGGACRFYGEDDDPKELPGGEDAIPFNSQKPWKRLIVVFAGPFMNFVLAYVLAVVMLVCFGDQKIVTYDNGDYGVVINGFAEESRAQDCGMELYDVIVSVDGHDVSDVPHTFDEKTEIISKAIDDASADGVSITVLREGELKELFVSNIYNEAKQKNVLGITMGLRQVDAPVGFFEAFGQAGEFLVYIVKATFEALINGIRNGFNQGDVTGIVGTVAITMSMASRGFRYILLVMIIVSMSLGIMNLLPLLPLDGGHLLFDFIELIFRKPVPRKIQNALSVIGFGLLIALMIYATIGDIRGLIDGVFNF